MERKVSRLLCFSVCSLFVLLTVSGLTWAQCVPSGTIVIGSLGGSDPGFATRIYRDGTASVCDPQKTYPGTSGLGGYFDLYTYTNSCSQNTCVSVSFNAGTCGAGYNAHMSAWSTGFILSDTGTWAASYLGDIGSSPSTTGTFSFPVPANSTFYLLVQNNFGSFDCDYSFTIGSCVGQLCYYNCIPGSCPVSHCDVFLPGDPQTSIFSGQVTYSWPGCTPGTCPSSACSIYTPLPGPS